MTPKMKLKIIHNVKNEIKNHYLIQEILDKHNVKLDKNEVIDLIPVYFEELPVSARTQKGIIYFNEKLLERIDQISAYFVHEFVHVIQQCFSSKPTQGSTDGDYLDNKFEQEAFRNQTEYLSETKGDDVAENYIDKVLDHHDVNSKKEREQRKKKLLELSDKNK